MEREEIRVEQGLIGEEMRGEEMMGEERRFKDSTNKLSMYIYTYKD